MWIISLRQVKTLKDEFESRQKLFDEMISTQSAIATKDDIESFGTDVLEIVGSLGNDLGIEVRAGIKDIFTPSSSNVFEQTVRSELKEALSVLETKFKVCIF